MNDTPSPPNPDRAALERTGALVRERLASSARLSKIDLPLAELWVGDDFLSEEECAGLVAMIDLVAFPSEVLSHGETGLWRTSSSANLDPADPLVDAVEQRISDLLGLPNEWGETLQGQRYEPGQYFREHMDTLWTKADYWPVEEQSGGQRSFTAMIYLDDVEAGGETHFPRLGVTIAPCKGAIVVWNNACPDGSLNDRMLHAGLPVTQGAKHIVTKWYRTRSWGNS